jgi:hypothetical protein
VIQEGLPIDLITNLNVDYATLEIYISVRLCQYCFMSSIFS